MYRLRWWLVGALYAVGGAADLAGRAALAVTFAVVATVALVGALELDGALDDDDEHGLTVEHLALVLVYSRQLSNGSSWSAEPSFVQACRLTALGLEDV